MQSTAVLKNLNISPFKVRLVADQVRSKQVLQALDILKFSPKDAAFSVAKVIKSAMHNGTHNKSMKTESMFVKSIIVNPAVNLKRVKPRAKGKADRVTKRACHIVVVLEEKTN